MKKRKNVFSNPFRFQKFFRSRNPPDHCEEGRTEEGIKGFLPVKEGIDAGRFTHSLLDDIVIQLLTYGTRIARTVTSYNDTSTQ